MESPEIATVPTIAAARAAMIALAQAVQDASGHVQASVTEGRVLKDCSATALLGADKLAQAALIAKSSDSRAGMTAEQALLALRYALLRVADVSAAVLAYDTEHHVSSRVTDGVKAAAAQATAAISEAQARVRGAQAAVAGGISAAVALPAAALGSLPSLPTSSGALLSTRSGRLRAAYEGMRAVHAALVAAAQRGSEQASGALASLTAGGVGDAVAYATEELGRTVTAAQQQASAAIGGVWDAPAAAAAESLALARGALEALAHRLSTLGSAAAAATSAASGVPAEAAVQLSPVDGAPVAVGDAAAPADDVSAWAAAAVAAVREAVTNAAAAVSRAATDASQAAASLGGAAQAAASSSIAGVSQATPTAAIGAALALADRGVALAVAQAANLDKQHHIVERLQTLDAGYGVTGKVARATTAAQDVAADLDRQFDVTGKAQALLGRAAALDAAVAGGRGAALAGAALALGASLAGQGASYALGVVADFNVQRGAVDAQQLQQQEGQLLAEGE